MKIFILTILLMSLVVPAAMAEHDDDRPCQVGACFHNNSQECRNARNAFAEHHNGLFPEQWCNQWYQGQQGRWYQQDKTWHWEGNEGDQWFQGQQGHWFQQPHNGWEFLGDKGDEYRKEHDSWQWSRPGQRLQQHHHE